MHDQIAVRSLKDRGMGIREIARELRLSRNTVRRYLRDRTISGYPARPAKSNVQSAPFIPDIEEMLAKDFIGSRIIAELRKRGYRGSGRTFYRQLARLEADRQSSPAVERFETAPARQGQYDWSEYTVLLGSAVTKVYIHSFILGYSRYQHLSASLHVRQAAIFEALEDSFACVRGVPKEMLFDNPRALVIHPKPNLVFNPRLLEFARFYGFAPRACWPGRAQTKGKVERPFQMIEEHFIKGSTFLDWADLNRRLTRFEAEALNDRIHGTTQERPQDRLLQEQLLLGKLPETRFISSQECFRKVSMDCLVSYDGSRYSVPWQYAGKHVWLRLTRNLGLEIMATTGEVLTRHRLNPKSGSTNIIPHHYQGLKEQPDSKKHLLSRVFRQRFPEESAGRFLEKLLAQYKFNAAFQLRRTLTLASSYPREAMLLAFEQALVYNTFSSRFLDGLLRRQAAAPDLPEPTLFGPERVLPQLDVTRRLDRYQALLNEVRHD